GDLRGFEGGHVLGFPDVLRERELSDADDGGAILERHGSRLADRATPQRATDRRAHLRGPSDPGFTRGRTETCEKRYSNQATDFPVASHFSLTHPPRGR